MYVLVYVSMCVCVFMYVCMCMYVSVYVHVCTYVKYMCMLIITDCVMSCYCHVYRRDCSIHDVVLLCRRVCVGVCERVCVCVCVCVCV